MDAQIEDGQYFKEAFSKMDSMRKNGLLCDVTLITKGVEISAHKVVLAASSEYFANNFGKMGVENSLNLDQIDAKSLLTLIEYIYTSRITIEIDQISIQNLLMGANILQVKNIQNECCKYLENHLNTNTSLKILSIAQDHKYINLLSKAETLVDKNFNEIMNTQEFLDVPVNQLIYLISRDTLEVASEEKIYEGIMSWLKYDLTIRIKHLSDLMSHVRLKLISVNYLSKNVITESLIQNDVKCKDLMLNALLSENIYEMSKPISRNRRELVLLVMGGVENEAKKTFEFYNFKTNTSSIIHSMPKEKVECSLVSINREVYVVNNDAISKYDVKNNSWCSSVKMILSRSDYGIGVLNDCIYVVGGYSNERDISSVEKFEVGSQKWSSVAPISNEKSWVGVGELNGLLYAVGGCDSLNNILKVVEFYDPELNLWKRSCDLITARTKAAVGTLHNKLYVIGGSHGHKILNSVECFSPISNTFTEMASLNIPREDSTVIEYDDKLYVIGGRNEKSALDTIEVYCTKTNQWELLPTKMNVARSKHGVIIVDKVN